MMTRHGVHRYGQARHRRTRYAVMMSRRGGFPIGVLVFAILIGGPSLAAVRIARPPLASGWYSSSEPETEPSKSQANQTPGQKAEPPTTDQTPPPPAADREPDTDPDTDPDPDPDPVVPVTPAPTPAPPTEQSPQSPDPPPVIDPGSLQQRTGSQQVALTFDDGPHPVWTPQVLDQLRVAQIKATFCVVGTEVRRYPALVARIVREGHTLCNHSWRHEFELGARPEEEIRADLARTNTEIRRAVPGAAIRYFRHPGGEWTPAAIKVVEQLDMVALGWAVDPRDWERPASQKIIDRVLDTATPGSVILLHDGGGDRSDTVAACPGLITELRQRYGITLLGVTLSP